MERRAVGRSGVELSVVGIGTAQLQMLPERQAIATLVRAFERGVNWVHSAPDYGGVERWIAQAIAESGRDVTVLAQCTAFRSELDAFFDNTCHVFKRQRLPLYGINCIEDIEFLGENVWGPDGIVEALQRKKSEGRLGGIFCTTHGEPDYVARLIESGVFDAIMLAYNPLGFHQLTHYSARKKAGRGFENLAEYKERIFPLAALRGVSLLVMKPLAGGLLCRGKALPQHDWYAPTAEPIAAADILKLILEEPAVCAVVPGMASPAEADENTRAGEASFQVTPERRTAIARAVATMRRSLCSRCGECETTCSKGLSISAMFRDGYIWTGRNETWMGSDEENYFRLHPDDTLACVTCTNQSCRCPQGIAIPSALAHVHKRVHALRDAAQHPGPLEQLAAATIEGVHRVQVLTREFPAAIASGATGVGRFLVHNVGAEMWPVLAHNPDPRAAMAIGVEVNGRLRERIPIRNNVCAGERSMLAFEFRAPRKAGEYDTQLVLTPITGDHRAGGTVFHKSRLTVTPDPRGSLPRRALRAARRAAGAVRRLTTAAGVEPGYGVRWVEHTIPAAAEAGATYGVRITFANTGSLVWRSHPADGHSVDVFVLVDEAVVAVVKLPEPEVLPGGSATIHFALRAPAAEGTHVMRAELVHQHVAWFGAKGAAPLVASVDVTQAPPTATSRAATLSARHNHWHFLPTQGIAHARDGRAFPLFAARAKGCRFWDADGREFLDYTMGWGSTILGHADDRVQAAIREVLDSGPLTAFPHPLEMDVSEMIVDDLPGSEMVVFGKNGSDVCTIAVRMARAVTGRRVILSCGFHGWQDFALEHFAFADSGIPERSQRSFYKFRFNDREDFLRLYQEHARDLAAVMIEPAGPWIDDEAGAGADADPEFLHLVADAARRANALVIFDEIITGYRYPKHSVQRAVGVVPDLTCLGKALASGMPLSALAGSARIFYEGFSKTHYCPTFKAEVYSLAAARAAIPIYRREPIAAHIWAHGERLRDGVHELCRQVGIAGRVTGPPFRMGFVFSEPDPRQRQLKRTLLMQELLKDGVVTATCVMLPSAAHDEASLQQLLGAFGRALDRVAKAEREHALHQAIEIPLI